MDPYRGFHRRLGKRQGLGVLGGLIPDGPTSSAAKQSTPTSAQNSGPGGIIAGLTSLVGDVPTATIPSSGPSSTTTSSPPLTRSSSSSTGSTTTSASSVHTTASRSPTTSASTPTTSSTPTPTTSGSQIVYASSDGTSFVYVTSTLSPPSATAAPPTSFLQNPSLEAGVFTLVGIAALIIIFVIVTWALRKRRRDRLERDLAVAVTFDPSATDRYERQENSIEKHRLSGSSSGYGHGYGYSMQPAYAPQQEYHGPMGYGQYSGAAYQASSNPVPNQSPSPTPPQPAAQGGANLTRKFSDRKPVPPLLPTPAYDPSNTHVSIPPQFYQQ